MLFLTFVSFSLFFFCCLCLSGFATAVPLKGGKQHHAQRWREHCTTPKGGGSITTEMEEERKQHVSSPSSFWVVVLHPHSLLSGGVAALSAVVLSLLSLWAGKRHQPLPSKKLNKLKTAKIQKSWNSKWQQCATIFALRTYWIRSFFLFCIFGFAHFWNFFFEKSKKSKQAAPNDKKEQKSQTSKNLKKFRPQSFFQM